MQARNKWWLKYEQDSGNKSSLEGLYDICGRRVVCYNSGTTDENASVQYRPGRQV